MDVLTFQTVSLYSLIIFMLKAYTHECKCTSPDSNHTQTKSLLSLLLSALISAAICPSVCVCVCDHANVFRRTSFCLLSVSVYACISLWIAASVRHAQVSTSILVSVCVFLCESALPSQLCAHHITRGCCSTTNNSWPS